MHSCFDVNITNHKPQTQHMCLDPVDLDHCYCWPNTTWHSHMVYMIHALQVFPSTTIPVPLRELGKKYRRTWSKQSKHTTDATQTQSRRKLCRQLHLRIYLYECKSNRNERANTIISHTLLYISENEKMTFQDTCTVNLNSSLRYTLRHRFEPSPWPPSCKTLSGAVVARNAHNLAMTHLCSYRLCCKRIRWTYV